MNTICFVFPHLARILQLIDDDLVLPLEAHASKNKGGFFGISRQVFCFFDYLGSLAYSSNPGKSTTKDAIQFMSTYLVRVNKAYDGKCALMYHMWRHGTVHELDPKSLSNQAESFEIQWMANNSSYSRNREWHLKCLCIQDKPNRFYWNINLFELVDDLRETILHFMSDLENNSTYLSRAQKNLNRISQLEKLGSGEKKDSNLLSQAEGLVSEVAGVVDKFGNVIQKFNSDLERNEFLKSWSS